MNKNGIKIPEEQAFVDSDITCQDIFIRSLCQHSKKKDPFSIPLTEEYLPEVFKLMLCLLQVRFYSQKGKAST